MKHVDVILPSQHFGPSKKPSPELRLMIAVLEDAITCVTKYRFATDAPGRRLFDEEYQWLFGEETRSPYSFECICDVLGLDADAVRQSLGLFAVHQAVSSRHEIPIAASASAFRVLRAAGNDS